MGRISPQIDMRSSVENEYLCLEIARAYGLPVPSCEILDVQGFKVQSVERFDRKYNESHSFLWRLPQEDFCQVKNIPPGKKYESDGGPGIKAMMHFLLGSTQAEQDRINFMKAQVLFWLLAAIDGHAQNFSFFLLPGGRYQLTPFYDILSAYPTIGKTGLYYGKIKLAMALKGRKGKQDKVSKIYPRHFMQTAKEVGFNPQSMQEILSEYKAKTPEVLNRLNKHATPEIHPEIKAAILNGLESTSQRLEDI